MEFVKLEILDFGQLNNNRYFNELINWSLNIQNEFEANLLSQIEREEIYAKSTSGILMNSVTEINQRLIWTDLIELKKNDGKLFLRSSIRRVNEKEDKIIQENFDRQIKSFKEPSFINQDFNYETGKISLGQVAFDYIEFSEIKYIKGNSFSIPFIKLLGVHNGILIRIVISFYNNIDKLALLNSIEINKMASH